MAKFCNTDGQPQKGIYGWFTYKKDDVIRTKKIWLYIGNTRNDVSTTGAFPSTLQRGVNELARTPGIVYKNGHYIADTDFVVGQFIKYFENAGYCCYWTHIDDDPDSEHDIAMKCNKIDSEGKWLGPILQNVKKKAVNLKFQKKIKSAKIDKRMKFLHYRKNLKFIYSINREAIKYEKAYFF